MATKKGTSLQDTLSGGAAGDTIYGYGGADLLVGNGGNDTIYGGTGNDRILGGSGNDRLYGHDGSDRLYGGLGTDSLVGGTGTDTLYGGGGNDTYYLTGADVASELGGGGIDTVRVSDRSAYTLGAGMNNLVIWTANTSVTFVARGNSGANIIDGRQDGQFIEAKLKLFGLGGNDRLIGASGDDTLDGGSGIDSMSGGRGDDTYYVDSSLDRIYEIDSFPIANGSKNDLVYSTVSYTLPTDVEDLTLLGTANRAATGNVLSNTIHGNSGNNVIKGAGGYDFLYGGGGADFFVYSSINDSGWNKYSDFIDHIFDLNSGDGDRIDLRLIDADPNALGNQAFVFLAIESAAFTAVGQVRFDILSNSVAIEINTDADSSAEMVIEVMNGGTPVAGWFLL